MSRPCSRFKRLFCWMWHRQGHYTAQEIQRAKAEAAEMAAYFAESQGEDEG